MLNKLIIQQVDVIHIIDPSNIIFCQASNCYTNIYLLGGERHMIVKSLLKFSKELCPVNFIRVNQSFLINRGYIKTIDKKKKNISLLNNQIVPFTLTLKELLYLIKNEV